MMFWRWIEAEPSQSRNSSKLIFFHRFPKCADIAHVIGLFYYSNNYCNKSKLRGNSKIATWGKHSIEYVFLMTSSIGPLFVDALSKCLQYSSNVCKI